MTFIHSSNSIILSSTYETVTSLPQGLVTLKV